MEESNKKVKRRLLLTVPLLIFALLLLAAAAYAWFSKTRELKTASEIAEPNPLAIKASGQSDPMYVNIPSIDLKTVDNTDTPLNEAQTTFVFCVLSNMQSFNLVLAHTTNIPVSYRIYPVSAAPSLTEPAAPYGDYNREVFYPYVEANYLRSTAQAAYEEQCATGGIQIDAAEMNNLKYKNMNSSGTAIIDNGNSFYTTTYKTTGDTPGGTLDGVQKNAMPLYFVTHYTQGTNYVETLTGQLYKYCTYFVLVIDWSDFAGSGLSADDYSKETDMAYLVAGT